MLRKSDIELLKIDVSHACGAADVCKVNHHGCLDAMSEGLVRNVEARDCIFPIREGLHIQLSVVGRIISPKLYEGKRTKYFINIPDALAQKYKDEEWFEPVCKDHGHIIVKVSNRGKRYEKYVPRIFIHFLDSSLLKVFLEDLVDNRFLLAFYSSLLNLSILFESER